MITSSQAVHAILIPFVISAFLAALGRWRSWRWMMPTAVGAAFLTGYGLLEVPRFPPIDGTDWLFWLAIPATLLAIVDSILLPNWGWAFGAAAARRLRWSSSIRSSPARHLPPSAVARQSQWPSSAPDCAWRSGRSRRGSAVGPSSPDFVLRRGASIVVLASDSASVGIRGLAGAAALAPLVLLTARPVHSARSISMIAVAVLAGILAGGHFYAGVTFAQFAVLLLSPALLLAGFAVPGKRRRLAGSLPRSRSWRQFCRS